MLWAFVLVRAKEATMAKANDSKRTIKTGSLLVPRISRWLPMPPGVVSPRPSTQQANPSVPSSVMSTKSSLKYEHDKATGQQVHLYEDVFDEEHVCLELEGFPVEVASSVALSGQGQARITLRRSGG